MNASEFAKTHACDADWIAAMGDRNPVVLRPGQRGTYAGFRAAIIRHYRNGMYEIRTAGGSACVDGNDFVPDF